MKQLRTAGLFLLLLSLTSFYTNSPAKAIENLPEKAPVPKRDLLLTTENGVKIYNGGFGSGLAFDGQYFYVLTDRGPNIDGAESNDKIFPKPDFTPQVARLSLDGKGFKLDRVILLQDETGKNLTGIPNPSDSGGNGRECLRSQRQAACAGSQRYRSRGDRGGQRWKLLGCRRIRTSLDPF